MENDNLEQKYEQENKQPPTKKQKVLLPIKTAEGLVPRSEDLDESDYEQEQKTG